MNTSPGNDRTTKIMRRLQRGTAVLAAFATLGFVAAYQMQMSLLEWLLLLLLVLLLVAQLLLIVYFAGKSAETPKQPDNGR